jgi:proteasome lid subunit RPN8/RPN11
VNVTAELRAQVLADCQARAPAEAVGVVLLQADGTARAVPLRNLLQGSRARRAFEVDLREWMALERDGHTRVAVLYHCHPLGPARLSAADQAFATPGGQPLSAGLELWLVTPDDTEKLSNIKRFTFTGGHWAHATPCSFD